MFRSAELELTLALRTYPPGAAGVATTDIVAVPSLGRLPMLQVIVVVPVQADPRLGVAEISVNPLGSVSVATAPLALDGPLFLTVTV